MKKRKLVIPANTYPFQNRSLQNLPDEVWKAFPDYEEYYEISNYGRIKRIKRWTSFPQFKTEGFIQEKIMSQKVFIQASPFNHDYCCYIVCCFRVNKQARYFRTARYVYYLFNKRFDLDAHRELLVQYKDTNGLNIHVDNLELSNPQKRQNRTVKRKRTPFLKPVTQFSLLGERLNYYETLQKAATQLHGTASGVLHALNKPPHYYKGYLWREGNVARVPRLITSPVNDPKPVIQCDLAGKELKTFPSLNQAAQAVGAFTANLRKAIIKDKHTCCGFTWKWKED